MNKKRTGMIAAVAITLGGFLLPVYAQQSNDKPETPARGATGAGPARAVAGPAQLAELQEIVVTGFRASLELSLTKKRDADSIMDIVSADDIGKLPDKNVADAVQRIPGVNISSGSGGEGGFSENDRVSIRGTNPSLTQTTVNGHSIARIVSDYRQGRIHPRPWRDPARLWLRGVPDQFSVGVSNERFVPTGHGVVSRRGHHQLQ
jgi:iron complex outermembrane recepter protein